jgi:hypothetical protein
MCRNCDLMVTWWVYTNKIRNLRMIVVNRLSSQDQANNIRRRVNFALHRLCTMILCYRAVSDCAIFSLLRCYLFPRVGGG